MQQNNIYRYSLSICIATANYRAYY